MTARVYSLHRTTEWQDTTFFGLGRTLSRKEEERVGRELGALAGVGRWWIRDWGDEDLITVQTRKLAIPYKKWTDGVVAALNTLFVLMESEKAEAGGPEVLPSPWGHVNRVSSRHAAWLYENYASEVKSVHLRQVEAFNLRYVQGRKHREVGEALGVSRERARQLADHGYSVLARAHARHCHIKPTRLDLGLLPYIESMAALKETT